MLREDYLRFAGRPPKSRLHVLYQILLLPGFRAVALFRLQDGLLRIRLPLLATLVRNINLTLTGADFANGATIGPGLVMRHPNGVVVGVGAVVGANCTILHQVTLGERRLALGAPGEYPIVGNDVILAAGAKVLGHVRVGDGAMVGANAVVTSDVLPRHIASGSPARTRPRVAQL